METSYLSAVNIERPPNEIVVFQFDKIQSKNKESPQNGLFFGVK